MKPIRDDVKFAIDVASNISVGQIGPEGVAAIGVYVFDAAAFAVVLAAYAFVAPGGGGIGVMVWAAFLIGQAYIVARLCVRLLFFASETALFQRGYD